MSRQCKARVFGTVAVRLVCDQCGKVEWFKTKLDGEDPDCLEWEAKQQAGWTRQDDCIVCSDECAQKFWEDDGWDADAIDCQGACGLKFPDWRALREHLDLVADPQYPDAGFLLSKTHIGESAERVWPCPDKDCGLLFFHDDPRDDHWHEMHEPAYPGLLSEDNCEGGYCSAPDGDPASVSECAKHALEPDDDGFNGYNA